MALCVAGDVDFGRICEIAREILPSERVEAPKHYYGEKESKEAFKSTSIINMEVAIPRFMIGVKLNIPEKGEEYLRAKLKAELIGKLIAGNSSRLYSKLYREGLINGDLSVEVDTFPAGAVLIFTGESRNVQQVYEELKNECCAFINSGVEAEALERTIKAFEGRLLRELNSLEDMCYNQVEGYIRDYSPLDSMRILFELTEDELCEFARENFVVECMALSVAK